jgi:hypothetical protein
MRISASIPSADVAGNSTSLLCSSVNQQVIDHQHAEMLPEQIAAMLYLGTPSSASVWHVLHRLKYSCNACNVCQISYARTDKTVESPAYRR